MPADDERRELFDVLEPRLGSRGAALLMANLPPVGWAELATKTDLGALRSELIGEMAKVEAKVDTFRAELKGDIAELRGEIASQVPKLWVANVATMFGVAGLVLTIAIFFH
jgi:hypothetical protein